MDTIVRIEFGSHLYGTATETSDHDYKSVHIPDARDILLQRVKDSTGHKVKRSEGQRNTAEDTDDESYSLQRYLSLLAEGQTIAIDMLFAPEPLLSTPLWDHIRFHKDKLLTKRSAAFVGYCRQQANKYGIKGSRVAAAKRAAAFFNDSLKHLGTTAKVEEVSSYMINLFDEHTQVVKKETTPGKFEVYFECCNRMVGFKNTVKEAASIFTRIYEEYGERARRAESNEGVDWKALSHAVRVGQEALELLATGYITFPLPNAAHILSIKQGKLAYEPVAKEIESLLEQVEAASKVSSLRDEADQQFIDALVCEIYGEKVSAFV